MELNFNSVETIANLNAEPSSLGYAEVPLTVNSVETIASLNASAAFQVDSGKVFKEDTDIVPVIVDDTLSYVPWGGDNALPYNILELIESDETLEQLIGYLFRIEEWWQSATRQWFTATLFPNIDLANLCGYNDHRWANYLGLRSKCIDLEQRIAEEFVSPEQLAVLREEVFSMSWDFSCEPVQCQTCLSIAKAMPKTAVGNSRSLRHATRRL